jgi:predicted metal-dependent hydrolase
MRHDLNQYLDEVAGRLERFPKGVVICWADDTQLGDANFEHWATCASPTRKRPVYVIAISRALLRAPKYVLRWLVLHECGHVRLPAWQKGGGGCHHYYFRQFERAHPDYIRANKWLEKAAQVA